MLKRKGTEDHDFRPRAAPFAQLTSKIRRSLAEIGEPGQSSAGAVSALVDDLNSADPEAWPSIFEMVRALVFEQPHKVPLLALVFELTNKGNRAIAEQAVLLARTQLEEALQTGDCARLKAFVRFVCALTIVEKPAIVALLEQLASKHAFEVAVTGIVYLKRYSESDTDKLEGLLQEYCDSYTESPIQSTFYGSDLPYEPKAALSHLVKAVRTSLESGWNTDFLPELDIVGPRECDSLHKFEDLQVPDSFEYEQQPLTRVLLYLPQDGVESVPDPSSLFGYVIRDVAAEIITNMDFNRKEVTRQLITLDLFFNTDKFSAPAAAFDTLKSIHDDGGATIKVEDIAIEAILEQMLQLPGPKFPCVYYHCVMVEACIMAPQAIAPVLGRALRFLFANSTHLKVELYWRVVSWFAHHMSNFAFTWKWHEWSEFLKLPLEHPKYVFMQQLIIEQVQLSYPRRVRDALPEEFSHLAPEIPEFPEFKFGKIPAVEKFMQQIEASDPSETLETFKNELAQDQIGKDADEAEAEYQKIVVTLICVLGNQSITHVSKWINKLKHLIEGAIPEELIIGAVMDYWNQSPWIGLLVTERFISAELVHSQALTDFIASHRNLLLSAAGYARLTRFPDEAFKSVQNLHGDSEWEQWWNNQLKLRFSEPKPVDTDLKEAVSDATESEETVKNHRDNYGDDSDTVEPQSSESAGEATTEPQVPEATASNTTEAEADQSEATEDAEGPEN